MILLNFKNNFFHFINIFTMKRFTLLLAVIASTIILTNAQEKLDELLPIRGIELAAPAKEELDAFVKFIEDELVPLNVNTLLIRIDWNYAYESRPELQDEDPLTKADVKKIVKACKAGGIRIIPQINLLGHQSWYSRVYKLLEQYPQFNETPHVPTDQGIDDWPNEYGLYCLSYCPLHPDLHEVVFDVVDEIVEVFETNAFHAGMDEVFYLGDDKCPRCSGRDKAELFAGEVTKISNHLTQNGRELWIWGDRLLDGKTTGIGFWEASFNNTHRAIDMIPKDVVICDWHYERADPTAVIFALKGFRVVTCPWNKAQFAKVQLHQMVNFRQHATPETKDNFYGMLQTTWSGAGSFMDGYYGKVDLKDRRGDKIECFKVLYEEINKLDD
jgi:hypothetical protein